MYISSYHFLMSLELEIHVVQFLSYAILQMCFAVFSWFLEPLRLFFTFSTVSWEVHPFFKFCVPELIFDGSKVIASNFHVWRSRTHFLGGLGTAASIFHILRSLTQFRQFGGRYVHLLFHTPFRLFSGPLRSFSRFVLLDSFSAVLEVV
jgi:hypothetical protein